MRRVAGKAVPLVIYRAVVRFRACVGLRDLIPHRPP